VKKEMSQGSGRSSLGMFCSAEVSRQMLITIQWCNVFLARFSPGGHTHWRPKPSPLYSWGRSGTGPPFICWVGLLCILHHFQFTFHSQFLLQNCLVWTRLVFSFWTGLFSVLGRTEPFSFIRPNYIKKFA
jgi:hypothetical protein